jgi:hypothetical protein
MFRIPVFAISFLYILDSSHVGTTFSSSHTHNNKMDPYDQRVE